MDIRLIFLNPYICDVVTETVSDAGYGFRFKQNTRTTGKSVVLKGKL
jgi:hypothetical protein